MSRFKEEVRVKRSAFEAAAPEVARRVLGMRLVRVLRGVRLAGTIVESEAYRGRRDPASHAYGGRTVRNAVMFGEAGHAYVYFSYGSHFCLNITAEPAGNPAAVLVRAVEPTEGTERMRANRPGFNDRDLTNGPGKLTKAFMIDSTLNGEDLVASGRLFLEEGQHPARVGSTSRVGISAGAERRWRFYVRGNEFVSKGKPSYSAPQNP